MPKRITNQRACRIIERVIGKKVQNLSRSYGILLDINLVGPSITEPAIPTTYPPSLETQEWRLAIQGYWKVYRQGKIFIDVLEEPLTNLQHKLEQLRNSVILNFEHDTKNSTTVIDLSKNFKILISDNSEHTLWCAWALFPQDKDWWLEFQPDGGLQLRGEF